jgi:hypothetical protein
MTKPSPRLLLTLSTVVLGIGAIMHARAPDPLSLIDSALLITLTAMLSFGLARFPAPSRSVLALLAILFTAAAFFLYKVLGNSVPPHLVTTAALAILIAAFLLDPRTT